MATTVSDLEAARIARLPDTAFYIPDFLTPEEETKLLQKVGLLVFLFVCSFQKQHVYQSFEVIK